MRRKLYILSFMFVCITSVCAQTQPTADLDTTNVGAVWDYADMCYDQERYDECEKYWLICLRAYTKSNDVHNLAGTLQNLAMLYDALHDNTNSEKYHKLALKNYEQLLSENPVAYRPTLANMQNNLGTLYCEQQNYVAGEKYMKLALENMEQLFRDNPDEYRMELAVYYGNMMLLYEKMEKRELYEQYLDKALTLCYELYKLQPSEYEESIIELRNRKASLHTPLEGQQ